jgi:hypothetical protein
MLAVLSRPSLPLNNQASKSRRTTRRPFARDRRDHDCSNGSTRDVYPYPWGRAR